MKIKKGDTIKVMIGKDKGKIAKVTHVLPKENSVKVEGINEFKKHKKARMATETSEIITISKPLHVSKVSLVEGKSQKTTRVGYKTEKGEKVRISRKTGSKI